MCPIFISNMKSTIITVEVIKKSRIKNNHYIFKNPLVNPDFFLNLSTNQLVMLVENKIQSPKNNIMEKIFVKAIEWNMSFILISFKPPCQN